MRFFTNNFSKYTSLPIVNLLFTYFLYSWYQPPEYKQNISEVIIILTFVAINISLGLFINQWVHNKRNINSKFPGEDKVMILSIFVSNYPGDFYAQQHLPVHPLHGLTQFS